ARGANHSRSAAGQIGPLFEWREPHGLGIEEQNVGGIARSDHASFRYAVLARRIAGQTAHTLLQSEYAALPHPVGEEVQAEAGIAEIDEMRAGVRERDHARRMLEERRDARV